MSRVDVLSGLKPRRLWSTEQKRAIVAEAFAPGASVSAVARRRNLAPWQIYRWRHDLGSAAPGFAEVVVTPTPAARAVAGVPAIEVEIGQNICVRIASTAPTELASTIVKALVAR